MFCAVNRWGKGTTQERPSNTAASKQLQGRLEAMRNERAEQDRMWEEPVKTVQNTKIQDKSKNN